jgi:hypothetical protein
MACDESQSSNCALLGDGTHHVNQDKLNYSMSLPANKSTGNNVKWTVRHSISSASLRRYRSPFRRNGINTSSTNSENSQPSSFPLFRRFYLMRTSFKHKRQRLSRNNSLGANSLFSGRFGTAPRIETFHLIVTMFITITSAFLLICMIFLDLAYLNDAIPDIINHSIITSNNNNNTLCFRYPKVCVMKALVIIVFIGIAIILCYSVLTLYVRARRHSRLLERKTEELEKEKCLTEKLLHQILPPCVAKDLINGRKAPAEYYDSVTVYFSDIVGFTGIAR